MNESMNKWYEWMNESFWYEHLLWMKSEKTRITDLGVLML